MNLLLQHAGCRVSVRLRASFELREARAPDTLRVGVPARDDCDLESDAERDSPDSDPRENASDEGHAAVDGGSERGVAAHVPVAHAHAVE